MWLSCLKYLFFCTQRQFTVQIHHRWAVTLRSFNNSSWLITHYNTHFVFHMILFVKLIWKTVFCGTHTHTQELYFVVLVLHTCCEAMQGLLCSCHGNKSPSLTLSLCFEIYLGILFWSNLNTDVSTLDWTEETYILIAFLPCVSANLSIDRDAVL